MTVVLIAAIQTWLGLSTDTKPTTPPGGSTFYETDTSATYVYDGSAWQLQPKVTDGIVVTRAAAALPQTAAAALFTVTGLVLLKRIVGYVTVGIGAVANATKIKGNSTGAGATTDLCTTLDINGHVATSRYEITGTFANAMVRTLDVPLAQVQAADIVIPPGTIDLDCAGSDGGVGRVRWSVTYVPLESNAAVVAA